MDDLEISLIIPTLNEGPNLRPLVERIALALNGRSYEILIVDDQSRDNTPEICHELGYQYPVRLLIRDHPRNGLSGAVLHGMSQARGKILVVMDADLQHPPEAIPRVVQPLLDDQADFVIGSRYVEGGTIEEGWSVFRALNSRVATLLARPFAGKVHDPMSGFLALRRADYLSARRLTPLGYKIGLELLCKTRAKRVLEVPIHFKKRHAGESKLSLKEQFRYLEHLSRLYDFSYPRLSPILKFLIVTTISWLVAGGYYVGLRAMNWGVLPSVITSYFLVIAVTAVFHARYVRTQREFLIRPHPWRDFTLSTVAEWMTCMLAASYLVNRAGILYEVDIVLISFISALFIRYVLRKELLLDVRGLRHELRKEEMR